MNYPLPHNHPHRLLGEAYAKQRLAPHSDAPDEVWEAYTDARLKMGAHPTIVELTEAKTA